MDVSDGFIPIVAVFYAVFHPTEGTKIIHQVPENSIVTTSNKRITHKSQVVKNPSRVSIDSFSSDHKQRQQSLQQGQVEDEEYPEEDIGLFNFDTVKNYVIPKPQLCNRLISFKINKYKVIGYPVNMENPRYSRNSFSFNFCFVFPYDKGDISPYEPAIKRMGQMFQVLEEQNFLLSKLDKDNSFFKKGSTSLGSNGERAGSISVDSNNINIGIDLESYTNSTNITPAASNDATVNAPGHSKTKRISLSSIESLIHQIYQDLNNYSECCIPLDSSNSVDIKLFPILPAPINLKAYQVPISTVKLNSLVDVNWDPTMVKILPFINGLNSVKRISELANANYLLTKQCIQHLMHYKCIEIIDIFQFNNIYAPTNHIGDFLKINGKMAEECQAYIITSESNVEGSSYFSHTPTYNHTNSNTNGNSLSFHGSNSISPYSTVGPSKFGGSASSSYTKPSSSSYLSKSPKTVGNSPNISINVKVPTKTTLFYLYRSLNQGQTVKEWYIQHRKLLTNIDIRRFINFGILRGIIYRVHTYPLVNSITRTIESGNLTQYDELINSDKKSPKKKVKVKHIDESLLKTRVNEQTIKTDNKRKVSFTSYSQSNLHDARKTGFLSKEVIFENDSEDEEDFEDEDEHVIHQYSPKSRTISRGSFSSSYGSKYNLGGEIDTSTLEEELELSDENEEESEEKQQEKAQMLDLIKMLKGYQNFDSICTEFQKSRFEVEKMIEKLGSYNIVSS
ncbi:Nitrogen permease regulator 2 [Spathaspora sp. JA1]|nr:Nitrogen permease regulator 2 [Spathaspora sp. JA1]